VFGCSLQHPLSAQLEKQKENTSCLHAVSACRENYSFFIFNIQLYRTHKPVYHSSHFCAVVLVLLLNNMLFALGLVAPCVVLAVRAPCALSSLDPCSHRATKLSSTLGRRPLPCCCRATGEPAAPLLLLAKGLRVLTTCTLLLPWKALGVGRRPGMCTGSGGRFAFS
jgi:hypothetical protein